MDDKIYTERKMLVGVAIGGPLAGGYYFWRSLNALGKPTGAVVAVIAAVVVLAATIACSLVPGLERVPNVVFYGLQFGLVLGVTRGYVLTQISVHIANGDAVYGWGNTILVAVVSMLITLGSFVGLFYLSPGSFDKTTIRYYGALKHEIVFDSSNLTELEVGRIASAMTSAGFFDEEMQKSINATKSGDRFILTMYCNENARDPEFIQMAKGLRSEIQKSFPANPIVIDLVIDTPENKIARLE